MRVWACIKSGPEPMPSDAAVNAALPCSQGSCARAQQYATRAAFFIPGFAGAIWAVLVPFAKASSGADDAMLGLILLCLGAGSLLAMPLAGVLAARLGCRRIMIATTAVICATLPGLALGHSPWTLGAMLFVFGAGVGALDCVMNMQAVVVEREAGRVMMSGFHAFFSLGGFAGAALMSALLGLQMALVPAALIGALMLVVIAALAGRHWRSEQACRAAAALARPRGVVLLIGILAFLAFVAEGAVLDWSAVFLTEVRQVDTRHAGVAYGVFALSMTITRLLGDAIVERLGRIRAIVVGALLASLGFAILTLVTPWQASLLGYGLVGFGCANVVPALFSLAGQQTRMPESAAITLVSAMGYAGILAGPALIGFAAQAVGLVAALLSLAAVLIGVVLSSRWLKARGPETGDPA